MGEDQGTGEKGNRIVANWSHLLVGIAFLTEPENACKRRRGCCNGSNTPVTSPETAKPGVSDYPDGSAFDESAS